MGAIVLMIYFFIVLSVFMFSAALYLKISKKSSKSIWQILEEF